MPNLISSTCFAIATVGSGLLMIPYCLLIPQAFPPDSRVRILAKIGQIGGFISCAGYAGVGLAPANLFRTVHYTCLFIAFAGTVILSISIGSAIIRSKILAKRYAYLFLLLAIFFICYSAILIFRTARFHADRTLSRCNRPKDNYLLRNDRTFRARAGYSILT